MTRARTLAEKYVRNWAKPNLNTPEENWALGGAFLAGWAANAEGFGQAGETHQGGEK